ncbi:hypothetical protein JCM19301_2752 [Jejuia pallidilutea]|uniref:Uncharacterized protein n=1 Tax=Jejuia pallidilutea TaxID=504487 RepID=A0A090VRN7_9FLAO|nr:hypothetical protein JCM19301_2752 [Jejuia pallidilutea]GAL70938.1 hypothetical protein JCM19302_2893 [Jejuia pallidilutea]
MLLVAIFVMPLNTDAQNRKKDKKKKDKTETAAPVKKASEKDHCSFNQIEQKNGWPFYNLPRYYYWRSSNAYIRKRFK